MKTITEQPKHGKVDSAGGGVPGKGATVRVLERVLGATVGAWGKWKDMNVVDPTPYISGICSTELLFGATNRVVVRVVFDPTTQRGERNLTALTNLMAERPIWTAYALEYFNLLLKYYNVEIAGCVPDIFRALLRAHPHRIEDVAQRVSWIVNSALVFGTPETQKAIDKEIDGFREWLETHPRKDDLVRGQGFQDLLRELTMLRETQ